jgi:NAD(P)-dependent dehydrogenase (short-subunit alcohol dehydrogenase family)
MGTKQQAIENGMNNATRQKENDMNIENKIILITGANRGIGRALVDEALKRGAKRVYAGTRSALQIADPRVTPVRLEVTDASQIQQIAEQIGSLDVLINNAGIAIYDDLTNFEVIDKHLAVNLLGLLRVTHAFLPALKRSHGAIVNNLSMVGLAALPIIPAYSISKAAAFSVTQSLRALLAGEGVRVHAVILGPVDTDMNRGLEIPKASRESAAAGIFDGLEKDEDEIFPDPASQSIADGWRHGALKALAQQFSAFAPATALDAVPGIAAD